MISGYFSRNYIDFLLHRDLSQYIARPFGNLTCKDAFPIVGYPNKIDLEIVLAMTIQSVSLYPLLVANATRARSFPWPEGEGFISPKGTLSSGFRTRRHSSR